ncbi:siderophore-interacting protein [Pseudonocardia halophobica]|uniref:siderophore-interacting protein n=1 Tax=Pseudonocardia halophobica TaxID=29401 RepID=UPI003D8FD74A
MARTNMRATRIKPEVTELLTTRVVRRERLSPHLARVTLGGGGLDRFRYLGFDQWFRLFIPVPGGTLEGLPGRLTALSYAKYLTLPKATRPVLRAYTVRAYRPVGPEGPEIDVDVVLHGTDGAAAGPGMRWAETCSPGDPVALLDEGVGFNPDPALEHVVLVAEESGLPATAAILASLPVDTRGRAVLEVPTAEDRQELAAPPDVEVTRVVRGEPGATPGRAALAAAFALPVPTEPFYGWTVGEQALPTGIRRHWVRNGVPKDRIMFCGYWREGAAN